MRCSFWQSCPPPTEAQRQEKDSRAEHQSSKAQHHSRARIQENKNSPTHTCGPSLETFFRGLTDGGRQVCTIECFTSDSSSRVENGFAMFVPLWSRSKAAVRQPRKAGTFSPEIGYCKLNTQIQGLRSIDLRSA